MADIADVAQEHMEAMERLQPYVSPFAGASLMECSECGDDIPEQRRKLGNVKLCFECQSVKERKNV